MPFGMATMELRLVDFRVDHIAWEEMIRFGTCRMRCHCVAWLGMRCTCWDGMVNGEARLSIITHHHHYPSSSLIIINTYTEKFTKMRLFTKEDRKVMVVDGCTAFALFI